MPKVPANAKKPTDRKAPAVPEGDATLKFERDGVVYESLPMSEALTTELIIEQPDPETVSEWDSMRFSLKLTLSAFRNNPVALEYVRKMSLPEVYAMESNVAEEAGVSLGE